MNTNDGTTLAKIKQRVAQLENSGDEYELRKYVMRLCSIVDPASVSPYALLPAKGSVTSVPSPAGMN